ATRRAISRSSSNEPSTCKRSSAPTRPRAIDPPRAACARRLHLCPRMANPRRVLVPLDGSDASTSALQHAVELAEENDTTTIDVIHVHAPHSRFSVGSSAPLAPEAEAEARRDMLAAVECAKQKIGDRVTFRTEEGEPLVKLLEIARDGHYDLIVMGTHGR